jgi:hypothetical protein
MKKQIVRILFNILFIGSMLVAPAGHAFASFANVNASLDWSEFSIFGVVLNPISQTTSTNATVSNSIGETGASSDLKAGWVDSSSNASISNANAQGQKGLSGIPLHQTFSSASLANLSDYGWSNSSGRAIITGSFTATTDSWVFVSVPYAVFIDLTASHDLTASAYGKARASVSLAKSGGTTTAEFIELFSTVYGGNTFGNSESGVFGLMKYFNAGETGTFTAEVSTETTNANTVPLPGALLLFAPGLACFFGLRRKFSN